MRNSNKQASEILKRPHLGATGQDDAVSVEKQALSIQPAGQMAWTSIRRVVVAKPREE